MSYISEIDFIINRSILLGTEQRGNNIIREWYEYNSNDGKLIFRLSKDNSNGLYHNFIEFQYKSENDLVNPIGFTWGYPKQVKELYFGKQLQCEIISYRNYGKEKLDKPKEIKGVKQSFSVEYIYKKCSCQCFVNGDDLWIKHRDFFSSSFDPPDIDDISKPLGYRLKKYFPDIYIGYHQKFAYDDNWGDIVLRNEAWLVFRNIRNTFKKTDILPIRTISNSFLNSDFLVKNNILELNSDWEHFFEKLCSSYRDFLKNEKNIIETNKNDIEREELDI